MIYPTNLRVLALDIASATGWAVLGGGRITSGVVHFIRRHGMKTKPDEHPGIVHLRFLQWLRPMLTDTKPDVVVYERAGHFKSVAAAEICHGFRSILMANCAYSNIKVVPYRPTEVKKFATGTGNADKKKMMAEASKRWPDVPFMTHDEADAYFLLHLHLSNINT